MQARAYQAQKFEALGTLAGGVAHDFNNILTGIINYATLARDDCPAGYPQMRTFLAEVIKCGDRAKELVRQILLFSRSETSEREPLSLQLLVRDALLLLRSTISPVIDIQTEIDREVPPVLGNATQLHQVIMNLAVNAVHAMGEKGGRLSIRLRQVTVDSAMAAEISNLRAGRYACLEVSDTGHGMEAEVVARIFEPFFTTKRVGEGTGLGLAIVRSVMKGHDGGIRVRSVAGVGTTFELLFPAHSATAAIRDTKEQAPGLGLGERVLLVEDDVAVADSLQIFLRRTGYHVTAFYKPEEALAHFWAAPDAWDAVLTDFQMPGMNGLALARKILSHRPDIPVIMLSGFVGSTSVETIRQSGIQAVFEKPIAMDELGRSLTAIVAKRRKRTSSGAMDGNGGR